MSRNWTAHSRSSVNRPRWGREEGPFRGGGRHAGSLIEAVIDTQVTPFRGHARRTRRTAGPAARLKALARSWDDMRDVVARYGCPVGTLSSELTKTGDGLGRSAARPMSVIVAWAEAQFREMGRPDARDLAGTFLAGIQGGALLASTLQDPGIMTRQVEHLERWIDAEEQQAGQPG
jgi:TetR/AcrR family transcriptional regulator, transcriptional repressor for nem operon